MSSSFYIRNLYLGPILSFLYAFMLLSMRLQGQDPLEWNYGRNDYIFEFEEVPRHFIVHVPQNYKGDTMVPVVFMFHGTTGDGERYWKIGKWKELEEEKNFITVFPSSWKYFITSVGHQQTKWNTTSLINLVPEGSVLKDDVAFITMIMEAVIQTFKIDTNRIYASGFSNGAGFIHTRIMKELNHRFAAVTTSGNLTKGLDNIEGRLLPLMNSFGTEDEMILMQHTDSVLPFGINAILQDSLLGPLLINTVGNLNLKMEYSVDSTAKYIFFHFESPLENNQNEFHFGVIKGLGHSYPNGNNFNFEIAPFYWEFMNQFRLNNTTTSIVNPRTSSVSCIFQNPYRLGTPIKVVGDPNSLRNIKYKFINNEGKVISSGSVHADEFILTDATNSGIYYLLIQDGRDILGNWPIIIAE